MAQGEGPGPKGQEEVTDVGYWELVDGQVKLLGLWFKKRFFLRVEIARIVADTMDEDESGLEGTDCVELDNRWCNDGYCR